MLLFNWVEGCVRTKVKRYLISFKINFHYLKTLIFETTLLFRHNVSEDVIEIDFKKISSL